MKRWACLVWIGALWLLPSSCIFIIRKDKADNNKAIPVDKASSNNSIGNSSSKIQDTVWQRTDTSKNTALYPTDTMIPTFSGRDIDTKQADPTAVVAFAKTLIGVPYQYAAADPSVGFDCSGFITYVFHHFGIQVPRSSIDFTNVGKPIPVEQARPGDIILFTGTDSTERFVGHMGIIVSNTDTTRFIHSTSGKKYGVTITPLSRYYMGRYVKTIRIFKQNDS